MFKLWSARKTSLCTDYYDGKKIAAMNAIHITWSYWRVNLYSSCFHIAVFRKFQKIKKSEFWHIKSEGGIYIQKSE